MDPNAAETPVTARWVLPRSYDLDETLRMVHAGPGDPTVVRRPGVWVKATRTPEGPATVRFERTADGVAATVWGAGAPWLLPHLPPLLGIDDEPPVIVADAGLARLARAHGGVRLTRVPWPLELVWAFVLQQRVAFVDAVDSHRRLTRLLGGPAPGPEPVCLPADPAALLRAGSEPFRLAGVDVQRAGTLREVCRYAPRVMQTAVMSRDAARQRIAALRGVGPWTLEMVMGFGFADADAVPVGDLHLPHMVCWALAGEARGSDARMAQLLEPYRGFRFRVIRWLFAAGIQAPRYGPRLPPRRR